MMNSEEKFPRFLKCISIITGALNMAISLINIVISLYAIIHRYRCIDVSTPITGAQFFTTTLYRTYILSTHCSDSIKIANLTTSNFIYGMALISLVFSIINLGLATSVVFIAFTNDRAKNADGCICVFVTACFCLFVVDVLTAVQFGLDYQLLSDKLSLESAGLAINYKKDMIRLGAAMLMTIAMKGYFGWAINIPLVITLAVLISRYRRYSTDNGDSPRTLGLISAYGVPSNQFLNVHRDETQYGPVRETVFAEIPPPPPPILRVEEPWTVRPGDIYPAPRFTKSGIIESAYGEPPSTLKRQLSKSDSYGHSNSWMHNTSSPMGSRPFSYLEDPKRPVPATNPVIPANEPQRHRDPWQPAPSVPDPDYSPQPRRLKSALKSNYI